MADLEAQARTAGAAARHEARARLAGATAPEPARSRTRPTLLVAAAAAAAVVVVGAVVALGVTDGPIVPTIDPVAPPPTEPTEPTDADTDDPAVPPGPVAQDGVLPVPDVGDATAAYLDDGSPVFVAQPEAGDVLVLDAVNPETTWGLGKLVSYCPSSGWFQDLIHESFFNGWGDYAGGPAPTGLAAYPTDLAADGATVRVVGDRQPAPEREHHRREEHRQQGPSCWLGEADDPTSAVLHTPPDELPALDGTEIPDDRWVWAEVFVAGTGDAPVVCDADGSCPADAPPLAVELPLPASSSIDGAVRPYLARTSEDGAIDVLLPGDPELLGPLATYWVEERSFVVPDRAEVVATYLEDSTPVFVSHAADGEVHVLGASSPDQPADLVAWCPSTDRFVDTSSTYLHDGTPASGPSTRGLPRYPTTDASAGEHAGITVTGEAVAGWTADAGAPDGADPAALDCASDWVAHAPTSDHVFEPDVNVNDQMWSWVRMAVEEVDGETYLCATHPRYVPACGLPSAEHSWNCADGDTGSECRPMRDPVVATDGVEPTDGPTLLLVLGSGDLASVQVRRPVVDIDTDPETDADADADGP